MKKSVVFAFVVMFVVCELFLSCGNASGSDSPMVGVTGVGVTQTGDGGTTTTTSNEPTAAENAKVVVAAIKALTESGTIKATGKLDNDSIREINAALKELASRDENILVTLDLSEVTGLTRLESAYRYGSYITSQSFFGCENLAGVILPSTLKSVGQDAFCDCTGLKSITIPASVTQIDSNAFSHCTGLEELHYTGTLAQWCEFGGVSLVFFDTNALIIDFRPKKIYVQGQDIKSIKNLSIPNGLTKISDCTFRGFQCLTSVTIPGSVSSIGAGAFTGCSSLIGITIPSSVTSIGLNAFGVCSALQAAYFSDTNRWYVKYLGGNASSINSASLANPTTAATYLTQSYVIYDWYKL